MAKLYGPDGQTIVGNFATIHFYQYGFGSDFSKEIKPHQKVLVDFFKDQQQKYLAKCPKCSDWGTVCGIYDRPFHNGHAKLLAAGVSIVSLDDCNRFDKKKGLLIAISRAAFSINKKIVKRTATILGRHHETHYVMVDR